MSVYLGVDGGGSKTAFVLVDDRGAILAEFIGGSSYYFDIGLDEAARVLSDGVGTVLALASLTSADVTHAFFGIPGYGEASRDIALLRGLPGRILGHDRYDCDNDMVPGWAGSLAGEDGINVICGTGSMTYGERAGRGCRVGGWGELFGDDGSAYWIAIHGLNLFTRMSDGRLPKGPLHGALTRRLGLDSDLDVVSLLAEGRNGRRTEVADLARVVSQAADEGDEEARRLLVRAGDELAQLVVTTAARLGYTAAEVIPVSFSGGVFASAVVRDAFADALVSDPGVYDLREPLLAPVTGAALQAARKAGTPLDAESIGRLVRRRIVGSSKRASGLIT